MVITFAARRWGVMVPPLDSYSAVFMSSTSDDLDTWPGFIFRLPERRWAEW